MNSQIKVELLNLDEKVATILMEEFQSTTHEDLLHVAQRLIKVVMDWHTAPAESDTPDSTA